MAALRFSDDHGWVRMESAGVGAVGITHFGQQQLGEIVSIALPQIGCNVKKGEEAAVIESVLLYFQEGIMCQPCWDQLKDIESNIEPFRALGIDAVVAVTTDPLDALKQKVAIERLSTPVLSDPDLKVSRAYDTNSYGMMGKSRNGHTFIVLDKEGKILWRADYGGAPKYHMYVPVGNLVADLRQGLQKAG